MTTRDQEEQDIRIRQMTTNIEQMNLNIEKTRQDIRNENRRIFWQQFAALTGAATAGAAIFGIILRLAGKI